MFDYSRVPVEIWYHILFAVIDVQYILDTMIDTGPDYWRNSPRYHDAGVYAKSEQQRKILRHVCHSWQAFADEHRHRWITYDPRTDENSRDQMEALAAIRSGTTASEESLQGLNIPSRPRRIMFHVVGDSDVEKFRVMIDNCSSKATIIFTECADDYEDAIFDHLLNQSKRLSNLRCLAICAPKCHLTPLSSLSKAFPKLVTLSITHKGDFPYPPNEFDALVLPQLKILGFDLSACHGAPLSHWDLQDMLHLHTPIAEDGFDGTHMTSDPLRVFGANLMVLNIHQLHVGSIPLRLPIDFWTWCPCLVELLIFFSGIYIDAPVPVDHPLKYAVHWPHYDTMDSIWIRETYKLQEPVLLHNLQLLPRNVEVFIVWKSWPNYFDLLDDRYDHKERNEVLVRMKEICAERSIRLEDEDKVTLHEYLARKPAGDGEDEIQLPNVPS